MYETGVSLGGGSLRGVTHIGAIQEMLDRGIDITHIAGTSAGAVVAGLFACGMRPNEMMDALDEINVKRHLDVSLNRKGWLKGDRIYQTLLKLTDGKHFSDLSIPLAVVCVDLLSRQLVILQEGEVAKALRASIAIPGVFSPVNHRGKILVDGYILNNNPADIVRNMGAKHVTAVRIVSSTKNERAPKSLIAYVSRYIDIASFSNTDYLLQTHADTIIDIDLQDIGRFEPKSIPTIIQKGKEQTEKILNKTITRPPSDNVIYLSQWKGRVDSKISQPL